MPVTIDITTGGGVTGTARQPLVDWALNLPDAYPGNVTFAGNIYPVSGASGGGLGAAIAFTGSPIALPAVPAGGQSTIWILQVNTTTGLVALKSNTGATGSVATPTADAGNLLLMSHTVTNGDTIPWARAVTVNDLN